MDVAACTDQRVWVLSVGLGTGYWVLPRTQAELIVSTQAWVLRTGSTRHCEFDPTSAGGSAARVARRGLPDAGTAAARWCGLRGVRLRARVVSDMR